MMKYETFKQIAEERIKTFLPPVFRSFDVKTMQVQKVNESKDTMVLVPKQDIDVGPIPNIYLEDMYEEFCETGDLDLILEKMAQIVLYFTGAPAPGVERMDLKKMKENIIATVINSELNRQLLETAPHYEVMDLSVVYRVVVAHEDGEGLFTALVNRDLMEELGISENELKETAERNMRETMPVKAVALTDALYVLTNDSYLYGAAGILEKDEIRKIADAMNSDVYLIPTSVHEIMVMSMNSSDIDALLKILDEGNKKYTGESEFLSDKIYKYERLTGEISFAEL